MNLYLRQNSSVAFSLCNRMLSGVLPVPLLAGALGDRHWALPMFKAGVPVLIWPKSQVPGTELQKRLDFFSHVFHTFHFKFSHKPLWTHRSLYSAEWLLGWASQLQGGKAGCQRTSHVRRQLELPAPAPSAQGRAGHGRWRSVARPRSSSAVLMWHWWTCCFAGWVAWLETQGSSALGTPQTLVP